ncbi:MAG: class I SAM-dependent methyltransferase [Dehalococcoidia bacterium]
MRFTAAHPRPPVLPVCRVCAAPIDVWSGASACSAGHPVPRSPQGVLDLRDARHGFADWWAQDERGRERFVDEISKNEEIHQERLMHRLVDPLLRERGLSGARVLSAGCGCGNDVETLAVMGYDAWGVDVGGRATTWQRRTHVRRLTLAGADALPFGDGAFDVVLAIDVLEHIGTDGDSATLLPDAGAQRQAAAAEMMRVTRPGGLLLMTGPNRQFPADPFHRQMRTRVGIRWHSWNERFLLSFEDHRRLFCLGQGCDAIEALKLDRFFSFTRIRGVRGLGALVPAVEALLRVLPGRFYRSPLNPFLVVLLHREAV